MLAVPAVCCGRYNGRSRRTTTMHSPRERPDQPARSRHAKRPAAAALAALLTASPAPAADPVELDPVVVTATRQAQRSFDLPASIDTIERSAIEQGQPMINLSETLVRVP